MTPDPLFPVVTVHCFWGWCPHTERGLNPVQVHDQIETHYTADHAEDIRAIIGPYRVPVIRGAWWEIR